MKTKFIIAICLTILIWAGSATANLIENGTFENDLDSWTIGKNWTNVQVSSANTTVAHIGVDQVMIDSYAGLSFGTPFAQGKLWQDFDVSGLSKIEISFDWVFNYWDPHSSNTDVFRVFLRDADNKGGNKFRLVNKSSKDRNKEKLFWGSYTDVIDMSGWDAQTARLEFRLTDDNGVRSIAGIDNVVVNPVPEPTTVLLFGVGLAGLVAIKRKKQN